MTPSAPVPRRLAVLTATIPAIALWAGGCAVPDSGPVQTVDPGQVPYNLLQTQPSPGGTVRSENTSGLGVYLTRNDRLVRLGLGASADPQPRAVLRVLDALTTGPTNAEQRHGIGTAIPPGLRLILTRAHDGLAEIDMTGDAAHPDIAQNALAAGQIVLTVTSAPEIERVLLTRNGERVDPALPHGELATRPVTATDYTALLRPRGTTGGGSPRGQDATARPTGVRAGGTGTWPPT